MNTPPFKQFVRPGIQAQLAMLHLVLSQHPDGLQRSALRREVNRGLRARGMVHLPTSDFDPLIVVAARRKLVHVSSKKTVRLGKGISLAPRKWSEIGVGAGMRGSRGLIFAKPTAVAAVVMVVGCTSLEPVRREQSLATVRRHVDQARVIAVLSNGETVYRIGTEEAVSTLSSKTLADLPTPKTTAAAEVAIAFGQESIYPSKYEQVGGNVEVATQESSVEALRPVTIVASREKRDQPARSEGNATDSTLASEARSVTHREELAVVKGGLAGMSRVAEDASRITPEGEGRPLVSEGGLEGSRSLATSEIREVAMVRSPESYLLARDSRKASIYFSYGTAKVSESARFELHRIAANLPPKFEVVVTGQTDPSGSVEGNERLAQARAESVASTLRLARSSNVDIKVRWIVPDPRIQISARRYAQMRKVDVAILPAEREAIGVQVVAENSVSLGGILRTFSSDSHPPRYEVKPVNGTVIPNAMAQGGQGLENARSKKERATGVKASPVAAYPVTSIHYDYGSAYPSSEDISELRKTALLLPSNSAIVVTGHTCPMGDQSKNDALALTRAKFVAEILSMAGRADIHIKVVADPYRPGDQRASTANLETLRRVDIEIESTQRSVVS